MPRVPKAPSSLADSLAMKGGGYYNAHAQPQQRAALGFALELLERASGSVQLRDCHEPLTIVDYAAAEGHNSIAPIRAAIAGLKDRVGEKTPIVVFHTDLSRNDFSSLFETVLGSDVYGFSNRSVFFAAIGRSYFDQLLPSGSVHLGWCANAVHWLSEVPCPLPGQLFSPMTSGSRPHLDWKERAQKDWQAFLKKRALELAPGGELIVQSGGVDASGEAGGEPIFTLATQALSHLVESGSLNKEEAARVILPCYYRSEDEYRAPFGSAPLRELLVLEDFVTGLMEDPFFETYRQDNDNDKFGASWANFVRAFTEDLFFGPLVLSTRNANERSHIADDFYDELARLVAFEPQAAMTRWRVVAMRIKRTETAMPE